MKPAPGNFSIWSHQERAVFTRAMLSLLAIRWTTQDARRPLAGGVDHDDRAATMTLYSTPPTGDARGDEQGYADHLTPANSSPEGRKRLNPPKTQDD